MQLGQRVHVAGVFDGDAIRLFVNGRLQETVGTMTSSHKVSNFRFIIGADPDFHHNPQTHFQGTIDAVHVARAIVYKENFSPRDHLEKTPFTAFLLQSNDGEGDVVQLTMAPLTTR